MHRTLLVAVANQLSLIQQRSPIQNQVFATRNLVYRESQKSRHFGTPTALQTKSRSKRSAHRVSIVMSTTISPLCYSGNGLSPNNYIKTPYLIFADMLFPLKYVRLMCTWTPGILVNKYVSYGDLQTKMVISFVDSYQFWSK